MPYADKEKQREYDRKYKKKRYHEDGEFRGKAKGYSSEWYKNNKERIKKHRQEHREEYRAYTRKWREENAEYLKKYREEHKDEERQRTITNTNRGRVFINEYKQAKGCAICGETDPIVLVFHHRYPEKKKYNIAQIAHLSIKTISKEIEKCDVLCANCHRRLHGECDKKH